ncbi:uncharacterized protein PSANT_06220 [Moesziomyces antarcticus]|nr:uncharacterized protein PSANT_06220 [Moesziomyces antarcticus]
MSTATELALPFMANHHRANNPDDPKLRANPSFKSRRSSLLANVLKPKSNKPDAARPTSSSRSLSSAHPHRGTTAHPKVGDAQDQRTPLHPSATGQKSRPPQQLQSAAPPPRPDSTPPNTSAGSHSNTASSSDTLFESLLSLDAALPKFATQHTQEPSHDSAVSTQHPSLDSNNPSHDDTIATPSSAVTTSASEPVPSGASVDPASQPISLPQSSSVFVTSPQRFSSLGRRSAARLTLNPSLLPSSLQMPRALARDINQELESPKSPSDALPTTPRNERRMSMLDFLATDSPTHNSTTHLAVQPAPASLSAEHLPASMPLMQASHQFSLGASASSSSSYAPSSSRHTKVDLCQNVSVSVEPLVDRLTMFGSMQSSSNYSLAGTVVVEVPKLDVPRVSAAAAISPDGSVSDHPAIHVEALTLRFIGYSVYVDATGRYNAIKLAEISQELLQPQGCTCPVPLVEHADASPSHTDAASPTVKYETEFDLSIPGWLPASQRSRFGATFYCVQASATVQGKAVVSALAAFGRRPSDGQSQSINTATSLEAEQREPIAAASAVERKESIQSASTTARPKSKGTWLNKRAKQLQLRSSKKSSPSEAELTSSVAVGRRGSGSKDVVSASASGERDPLFTKTSEASNQTLPDGQHLLKSECISILVRRCRDVVPVPVARLARLATAGDVASAEDAPPHSLSQSMLALAALQEAPATSNAGLAPTTPAPTHERPNLPASVSAPTIIAPLSNPRQPLDVPNANGTNAATVAGEPTTALTLAPSPRIDAHPARMGLHDAPSTAQSSAILDAERESRSILPPAPSAFEAPRDPAKLAAATGGMTPSATLPNLPSSRSRASSLLDSRFGNANSPPRTSSRSASVGRTSVPMRHFVHRPTLHLPPTLGATPDNEADGSLVFSLTLSLPSHVHVAGPKADVLSFGVQIEAGRTPGWEALRKCGGLRLKDMELVCLQTERHSSMPSRSFVHTFPVPPPPNRVEAADLPVVTASRRSTAASSPAQAAAEKQLRASYDRSLVLGHISLANQGKAPHPIEHNVERVRTTIVGPPPFVLRKRAGDDPERDAADSSRKGKAMATSRVNSTSAAGPNGTTRSPQQNSPAGSGTNTPDGHSQSAGMSSLRAAFAPNALATTSRSRGSVMQPAPRALARSNNSSSSSLRAAFQGTDGSGAMQPAPRSGTAGPSSSNAAAPRSRRPIPFEMDLTSGPAGPEAENGTARADGTTRGEITEMESETPIVPPAWTREREPGASSTLAARPTITSTVSTRSDTQSAPRRSRFETAITRLSTFASSMLEQPAESLGGGSGQDVRGGSRSAPRERTEGAAASLRASYAFAGDDGQGVDLNKGRVRMTINLPLVSNDIEAARKAGSAQLIPDFESPYVRVRHKLKVKLGFGMKSNVATGPDGEDWVQALVMCVPVRFTEAPPREVQEQFGPVNGLAGTPRAARSGSQSAPDRGRDAADTVTASTGAITGDDATAAQSASGAAPPFVEPLLPAYAQLFREDGSRLADEGEDLPRYPGRMSVVGEIDEDLGSGAPAAESEHGGAIAHAERAGHSLSTVDEDHASSPRRSSDEMNELAQASTEVSPHATLGSVPDAGISASRSMQLSSVPTPMDRTTSLPGHRMLTRTISTGVFGLRTSPSHPSLPGASQSATASTFKEAAGKARVGSSAFDPLPGRPGMRRRSATTASLMTFSRITPAEVLDEALVTNALDDEEDRMDPLQPAHTLNGVGGRRGRETLSSGQDDDGDDGELDVDDDDEEEDAEVVHEMDLHSDEVDSGVDSSDRGHHDAQLSGSGSEIDHDAEIGRAL